MLFPIGARNPGTGRHRRYEWAAVLDAAVLNALADHGIQTAGRDLLFALSIARAAHQDWEAQGRNGPQHFLEIASIRGMPAYVAFGHKGTVEQRPSVEVSTVVNLSQIFARLRAKNWTHDRRDPSTQHPAAKALNLEGVMSKPEIPFIGEHTPLHLDDAVSIAFPGGGMTTSGLRREARRGRLIAGKDFVTLAAIREMRKKCRVQAKAPDCGSAHHDPTAPAPGRQSGSSETETTKKALAAALATAEGLKSPAS